MSELLTKYEKRLDKRDINVNNVKKVTHVENLKFKLNGEINPYYGLTSIVWIKPETKLHKKLSAYQQAVKVALDQTGLRKFFAFLNPQSFHMTLCDIAASPTPIESQKAAKYVDQIAKAFSDIAKVEPITGQVQGVGFISTLSALVRFEEKELYKALGLEQRIKDAAQVNHRNFTGHISLAYLLSDPDEVAHRITEILRTYMSTTFGNLTFSQFDLTSFTDMNTFIPLLSINFVDNQIARHHASTSSLCLVSQG